MIKNQMGDPLYLSIVVPCYNEGQRLSLSLGHIYDFMKDKGYHWEIILVDDGSTDDTAEIIQAFQKNFSAILLTHHSNQGKGASVRTGVLNSRGKYILMTDADLSTPIEELDRLLEAAEEGMDIVIGSRGMKKELVVKRQPIYREMIGKTGNFLIRGILGLPHQDTQCGFKIFHRDAVTDLFKNLQMKRWSFDYEILYLAVKTGLKVREVPVTWANNKQTHFRAIWDSFLCFIDIWRIRWIHG